MKIDSNLYENNIDELFEDEESKYEKIREFAEEKQIRLKRNTGDLGSKGAAIEKASGVKIQFYSKENEANVGGFIANTLPNVIFVNIYSFAPYDWVIAHELTHADEKDNDSRYIKFQMSN